MDFWDGFDGDVGESSDPDPVEESAIETLGSFFEEHAEEVFFGNQLAVRFEDRYFHWITHRAIAELLERGDVKLETRTLATKATIKLVWNRRHRYFKRDAKRVVELVDEYGSPNMCGAIGLHSEQMILAAFAKRRFVMEGHHTREFRGTEWTKTQHNLDFIFGRDGVAYGIEVKNTLSYMDLKELQVKLYRRGRHVGKASRLARINATRSRCAVRRRPEAFATRCALPGARYLLPRRMRVSTGA